VVVHLPLTFCALPRLTHSVPVSVDTFLAMSANMHASYQTPSPASLSTLMAPLNTTPTPAVEYLPCAHAHKWNQNPESDPGYAAPSVHHIQVGPSRDDLIPPHTPLISIPRHSINCPQSAVSFTSSPLVNYPSSSLMIMSYYPSVARNKHTNTHRQAHPLHSDPIDAPTLYRVALSRKLHYCFPLPLLTGIYRTDRILLTAELS
jgi:hypothetical protein